MIGWVIVGLVGLAVGAAAVAVTASDRLWDKVRHWLNNTAADVVEKVFGYRAKQNMHRAITAVGNIRDHLVHRNAVVYTKLNKMDSFYKKVTYEASASEEQFDIEILDKIHQEGQLTQEFEYRV